MIIPPSLSDQDGRHLIDAFLAGSITEFETVYNHYVNGLCRYASTFVPTEDSLDIVQDVFLSVWHSRDNLKFATLGELSQYLFRSVRNRALNALKRDKLHGRALAPDGFVIDAFDTNNVTESDHDSMLLKVYDLIENLPARSREVLILRWQQGMDLEEIARVMGISYGSVRVLHSRALQLIKERFSFEE